MRSKIQLVILLLSFAALVAGGYLAYRLIASQLIAPPPGPGKKPSAEEPAKKPEVKTEVVLPEELREQMGRSEQRQRELFQAAQTDHKAGNYEAAAFKYRRVLSAAGKDRFAVLSYRFLGDINARRGEHKRALKLYNFALSIKDTYPEIFYRRGRVRKALNQDTRALQDFTTAIQLDNRPVFFLARGNYYFEKGRYDSAVADYTRGLEKEGEEASLLINRGLVYQKQEKVVEALEDYRQAREYSLPETDKYRLALNLGQLYLEDQQVASAVEEFQRARQVKSTSKAFYNLALAQQEAGETSAAIQTLNQAREENLASVDSLVQLGYLLQQTSQWDRAIKAYSEALDRGGTEPRLIYAVGRLYELVGQSQNALDYYRQVMETEPGEQFQQQIFRRVGELWLEQGKPRNAIPAFKNVIKLAPEDHETRYNLGVAYFRVENFQEAISEFRTALAARSNSIIYREGLARALYWAGRRKAARREFQQIWKQKPEHFMADYMVGHIDYQWGKMEAARERYQELLQKTDQKRRKAIILQNLGNIEMRLGNYNAAVKKFRESIQLEKLPESFYNLSLVFLQREFWDQALSALEKALEYSRPNPRIQTALGYVLYNKGLYRRAEQHLQKALKLNPKSMRARYDLQRTRKAVEEVSSDE